MNEFDLQNTFESINRSKIDKFKSSIDSSSQDVSLFLDSLTEVSLYEPVFRDGLNQVERYANVTSLPPLDVEAYNEKINTYIGCVTNLDAYVYDIETLSLSQDDELYINSLKKELETLYKNPSFFSKHLISEIDVLRDYYISSLPNNNLDVVGSLNSLKHSLELFKMLDGKFKSARSLRLQQSLEDLREFEDDKKLQFVQNLAFGLFNQFVNNGFFNSMFVSNLTFAQFLDSDLYYDIKKFIFANYTNNIQFKFVNLEDVILSSVGFLQDFKLELSFGKKVVTIDFHEYYHPHYHKNIPDLNIFQRIEDSSFLNVIDVSDVNVDNLSSLLEVNKQLHAAKIPPRYYDSMSNLVPFWSAFREYRDTGALDDVQLEQLVTNGFMVEWDNLQATMLLSSKQKELVSHLVEADALLERQYPGMRKKIESLYNEYFKYYPKDDFELKPFKSRYGKRLNNILKSYL